MSAFNLFRKQKVDPLAADTVPGSPGTRTMNNVPLLLGGAVLTGFLVIVGTIIMQRANGPQGSSQTETRNTSGSSNYATELTAPWAAGQIIPSTGQAAPPEPSAAKPSAPEQEQVPRLEVEASSPKVPTLDVKAETARVNRWELYQDRFDSARIAAFEAALKSPTSVQAGKSSAAPTAAPTVAQINDTRQRLEQTRQQLVSAGDPNALYQARLAAIRGGAGEAQDVAGGTGGTGGTGGLSESATQGNNVDRFTRSHTWRLPGQMESPAPYTVQAGFVLPAIMISGIISDLPGQVMAQVSQNVYDSPTGRHLLIPQGTRLIGSYNSEVAYGQKRVLMAWQRLVFPDGRTLDIQAMPGADSSGKAGFHDQVNSHFWRTIGSAFLLSGVIASISLSQNDKGDTGSDRQRASDSLSEALGQTLGSAMAEQLRKNINVSPTLEIRPGYRFNVMVSKDMTFDGPYKPSGY